MHVIDWIIVCGLLAMLLIAALCTARYAKSVSAFLAASRCGRRYLIAMALAMAGTGVTTLVYWFEIYYEAGFPAYWWSSLTEPALIVIALSGWIIYRYRQTRAMTLAQFFEMRYSRNFRVFAGLIAFISGIVNFGIYPSVGSRFLIGLCGLVAWPFLPAGPWFSISDNAPSEKDLRTQPCNGAAAAAISYGSGKAGTLGIPTLTSTLLPVLGKATDITLANVQFGLGPIYLFYGFAPTSLPFDGGTVLVLNALTVLLPGVAPSGSLPLVFDLPADPNYCGINIYLQALYVDPAASGNKHTAQTAGLHWVLGN